MRDTGLWSTLIMTVVTIGFFGFLAVSGCTPDAPGVGPDPDAEAVWDATRERVVLGTAVPSSATRQPAGGPHGDEVEIRMNAEECHAEGSGGVLAFRPFAPPQD